MERRKSKNIKKKAPHEEEQKNPEDDLQNKGNDPIPNKNRKKSKTRKVLAVEGNENLPKKKGRRHPSGAEAEDNKVNDIVDVEEKPNQKDIAELFPPQPKEEEGKIQLQIPLPHQENYQIFYSNEAAEEGRICDNDKERNLENVHSFDARSVLHDEIEEDDQVAEAHTNKCPVCEKGIFVRKDSVFGWIACVLCFPLGGPLWCRKACSNYVCNNCGASKY